MQLYPPESKEQYKKDQEDRHVHNEYEYVVSFWNEDVIDKYSEYLEGPILDVGCRNGKLLDVLEEKGYEAHGVELTDIADFAMTKGRKVLKLDFQEGTPYEDKKFKTIIMSHVLEHFYEPDKALQEAKRILSGYIIIHTPMTGDKDLLRNYAEYIAFENPDDICNLLVNNGFEIVKIGENNSLNQLVIAKTK